MGDGDQDGEGDGSEDDSSGEKGFWSSTKETFLLPFVVFSSSFLAPEDKTVDIDSSVLSEAFGRLRFRHPQFWPLGG
jgi:hypothetical protein